MLSFLRRMAGGVAEWRHPSREDRLPVGGFAAERVVQMQFDSLASIQRAFDIILTGSGAVDYNATEGALWIQNVASGTVRLVSRERFYAPVALQVWTKMTQNANWSIGFVSEDWAEDSATLVATAGEGAVFGRINGTSNQLMVRAQGLVKYQSFSYYSSSSSYTRNSLGVTPSAVSATGWASANDALVPTPKHTRYDERVPNRQPLRLAISKVCNASDSIYIPRIVVVEGSEAAVNGLVGDIDLLPHVMVAPAPMVPFINSKYTYTGAAGAGTPPTGVTLDLASGINRANFAFHFDNCTAAPTVTITASGDTKRIYAILTPSMFTTVGTNEVAAVASNLIIPQIGSGNFTVQFNVIGGTWVASSTVTMSVQVTGRREGW